MLNVFSNKPQPAAVPWGPWAGILLSFGGFFAVQILAVFLVAIGASILGIKTSGDFLNLAGVQFVFVLLSDALIIAALWLFLRAKRSGFRALGFGRSVMAKDAGYAIVGYIVYFALLIAVLGIAAALTGIDLDQKQELGFDSISTRPEQLMALLSLVILAPVVEEILFRGFLYTGMRTRLPFVPATIVTSLLFGGLHLLGVSDGVIWVAAVDTFVLSFILCYLREKTGALYAPIAVHLFKNAIAFVFLFTGIAAL